MTGKAAVLVPSWKGQRPLLVVALVGGVALFVRRSRSAAAGRALKKHSTVPSEVPTTLSTMVNWRRLGGSIAEIVTLGRSHLPASKATLKDVVLSSTKTVYQLEPEQRRELDAIMSRRQRLARR